jgi:hypothetical protein
MEFQSFGALGAHFAKLALAGEAVSHHIAGEGGKAIQADAKARIGSYQDGVGPFPAWANLAEATVDDRLRKGFTPDDPLLRTGGLRDSIKVAVTGSEAAIGSESMIALYQEQGTAKIPPRPFLGPAGFNSKETVGPVAALTVVAWVCGLAWRRPRITLGDL